MRLKFSTRPGRHERQLRYRHDNPFLPTSRSRITPEQLEQARQLDHEELLAFIPRFREHLREAAELQSSEGSERILELKEKLEICYEEACGLADDQNEAKRAIRRLLQVIMVAIRSGARGDPLALSELAQEEQARAMHFSLLESPLVADLLSPDCAIPAEELAAVLLVADPAELEAALTLFDPQQLQLICGEAEQLVKRQIHPPAEANLALMTRRLGEITGKVN